MISINDLINRSDDGERKRTELPELTKEALNEVREYAGTLSNNDLVELGDAVCFGMMILDLRGDQKGAEYGSKLLQCFCDELDKRSEED